MTLVCRVECCGGGCSQITTINHSRVTEGLCTPDLAPSCLEQAGYSIAGAELSKSCFSNGPDDVGRWQRATFKFLFFLLFLLHIQGTSIGLVRTNHALLSLADTNLVQYTCMCTSHWRSCGVYTYWTQQCRGLLSAAALRFFSRAEQCCTQNFYLRCFKSDTPYPGHWTKQSRGFTEPCHTHIV